MIDEFVVPTWVRLLVRMTTHHYRRSTAKTAVAQPVDDITTDPAVVAAEPAKLLVTDIAPAESHPQPVEPLESMPPADDGRMTREFLAAAHKLGARVQSLVVVPGEPSTRLPRTAPQSVPVAEQVAPAAEAEVSGVKDAPTLIPPAEEVQIAVPAAEAETDASAAPDEAAIAAARTMFVEATAATTLPGAILADEAASVTVIATAASAVTAVVSAGRVGLAEMVSTDVLPEAEASHAKADVAARVDSGEEAPSLKHLAMPADDVEIEAESTNQVVRMVEPPNEPAEPQTTFMQPNDATSAAPAEEPVPADISDASAEVSTPHDSSAAAPEAPASMATEPSVPEADVSVVLPTTEVPSPIEVPAAPVPEPVAAASLSPVEVIQKAAASVLAPAIKDEYNRTNIDYRRPMPRPKVRGRVIDGHCHLLARRHAADWFEAADHYGFFGFITQTPLEEATVLARDFSHRLRFVAVPQWGDTSSAWADNWLRRIDAFFNLGARIAKFHASPGNMLMRGHRLDEPVFEPLMNDVRDRGMVIMTHIGDPDTWYASRYTDTARFGSREEHYAMWERLLERYRGTPWLGAHLGGNPEDLPRLQRLLDKFPDLVLDCSATRWMVREVSARRDAAREFFIRNQDRIIFGSDQVSGDDRHFDFLASRIWCHRKLWETAYTGESPIIDPDVPADQQPTMRGLALPDAVLQKMYHDNPQRLLGRVGCPFEE